MVEDKDVARRLDECFPPLRPADDAFKHALLSYGTPVALESGVSVREEGQACTQLALILKGVVRVYKLSESGHEITLYRIEPGDSCILTASCILSGGTFPDPVPRRSAGRRDVRIGPGVGLKPGPRRRE